VSATPEEILSQALQALSAVTDLEQLDQVRVHYLGKKGLLTLQMKELGSLEPEQRRAVGQVINQAKDQLQAKLEAQKESLQQAALTARLASERAWSWSNEWWLAPDYHNAQQN
jgi:phenylalanyl-tRNA synthetase alpha chain